MSMADKIKERRLAMGYTQEELGSKLGLQKSAIAKYENGRVENIKRSVIAKMAEILECTPCYLLDWENQQESPDINSVDNKYINIIQNEVSKMNIRGRMKLLDTAYEMNCNPLYNDNYQVELAAAHKRTDISESAEEIQADLDMMSDENF